MGVVCAKFCFFNLDAFAEPGSSPLEPITVEEKPPVTLDVRYCPVQQALNYCSLLKHI